MRKNVTGNRYCRGVRRQILYARARHNLLNPKAGVFYIAILPTFVDETRPVVWQAVTLSIVYVTIATMVHATIVGLADAARPWLENERRSQIMRRALSLLLAGIAIWLFVTTRQI